MRSPKIAAVKEEVLSVGVFIGYFFREGVLTATCVCHAVVVAISIYDKRRLSRRVFTRLKDALIAKGIKSTGN